MSSNSASDCIETTHHRDRDGYGIYQVDGRKVRAHRAAMAEIHGWEALEGKVVMHLCDNPACINVDHLRVADQRDNLLDMREKGRGSNGRDRETHCKRGHELAGENLLHNPKGFRICRECGRQRWYLRRYGWFQPELPLEWTEEAVTHVTLLGDDMGTPVRYSDHTADRTARVAGGQHSETHNEENTQ